MFLKKESIDYISNFYRHMKYSKNTYLITVDDGNFLFLNSENFKQLKRGKIDDEDTYNKLENKGIIITVNNFNKVVEKTKQRYSFLMNGTSLHIVIPTSRCNLSCPYCFASPENIDASKDVYDLKEDTSKKIVEFIMESPSHAITIEYTGGEPTARFDTIKTMVLHARELNKKYNKSLQQTIVTNLTLMNDNMARWFIEHDVTMCTSFDGPKEVHDKNRVIKVKSPKTNKETKVGTYDKVVYWIKRINELYKEYSKPHMRVNALMTISRYSFAYYKEIIDEYVKLGMSLVDIRAMMIIGRATDEGNSLQYSKDEFIDFYLNSIAYIDELKKKGIQIEDRMRELYNTKIIENVPTYHTDYESPDGAAIGGLTYHSNGCIYTCHEALGRDEFKLGNVYEDTWNSLFKKRETSFAILSSMLEANVKCDRCAFKPYCGTSTIENFSEFGKFNFYPEKTTKHHETVFHCKRVFDKYVEKIDSP